MNLQRRRSRPHALCSREALLDDPSLTTLREACLAHNTWLFAHFAAENAELDALVGAPRAHGAGTTAAEATITTQSVSCE